MDLITTTREVGGVTIADLKILLNLAEVTYIDSSGLGNLINALAQARKQGGELKLVNLPPKVQDVMQITKLYTVFDILNDEAVAVRSFTQASAATN